MAVTSISIGKAIRSASVLRSGLGRAAERSPDRWLAALLRQAEVQLEASLIHLSNAESRAAALERRLKR